MSGKQTYWLHDGEGTSALVTGADERDLWRQRGWAEADGEPDGGFVTVWHEGIEKPGRVSVEAFREMFSHTGWVAGPPDGGKHPFEAEKADVKAPADDSEKGTESSSKTKVNAGKNP